ncbi:hypothetical protein CKAN_01689900 [Cinnamomum micranthum f. kanehirae]|uniref:SWIM-type domain-containing protein n=1 Tax=Cinnamomum micranthum f. kanehirae TaxID=337451 RepID=A0A3S3QQ60_9MAGN|nr:hypothetical protein CKAN_01689900 [Cinnamomum micranthum f. kanehirae]
MSDNEVLIIFHYDGEFVFDIIRPVYNGGRQKMRYLPRNITYGSLLNEALEASKWDTKIENLSMKYLHHNGRVFSLIILEDDNDIRGMLKASGNDQKGLYLYVNKSTNIESNQGEEHTRVKRKDMHGGSQDSSNRPEKSYKGKEVLHPTHVREHPTVNLCENNDMRSSSAHNVHSTDRTPGADYDIDRIDAEAEAPNDTICADVDFTKVYGNSIGVMTGNEHEATPINKVDPSNAISDVNFQDTMVPDDSTSETRTNSAREMWIGRLFPDRENFRRALAKFAIYNNFTLKHLKTNMTKVTARCKEESCPWRIHASIVDSGPEFKVRTYNPIHCCSKLMMGITHPQASAKLIEEFIEDKVRFNNHLKPKEIMHEYQKEFGIRITYRKAHIAKEMALRKVRGSYEESFKILPLYCIELRTTNPGTVTNIDTTAEGRFRRFFWAFGPCIRSFSSSMRPMIAVDGSHLWGKYPGVLLLAVTYDGNHKLFPIAFAFAEAECRDSWEWFLTNLFMALGSPKNLTIVSDHQKGLVPALTNIIPSARHCYCCHHIAENIKSVFSDFAIVMKFWRAAKAYRPCEFEACMNDILVVDQGAYNYINAIGKEHWSNAYVEGQRYEMLNSNAAECTNSLLKDTRVLPITEQVEEIRANLMEFFQKRHLESQNITTRLTPYAEKLMNQEVEESLQLHVRVAGPIEFQVQSAEFVDVVDLERRTCTCRKWEIMGIPCSHSLASMKMRNLNPYDFVEDWYLTTTYRTTYNEVLHATRDSRQWEHTSDEKVLPPCATKQPGRPKKNRVHVEGRNRQRRVVTCSNCKERGHNRHSCRNPPSEHCV